MKDKSIYDRDITLAIIIALVGIAIGFIVTMLFWPAIIESLDQMDSILDELRRLLDER